MNELDKNLCPLELDSLNLFIYDEPVLNKPIAYGIGYISKDGGLKDVTSLIRIEVLKPKSVQFTRGTFTVNSKMVQNVYLKAKYKTKLKYFSFVVHKDLKVPTFEDLYKLMKRMLPQKVYNGPLSNIDDSANSRVLAEIYDTQKQTKKTKDFPFEEEVAIIRSPQYKNIFDTIKSLYPDSGDPNWEMELMGTNSLYLRMNESSYYPTNYKELMKLIYQININNSGNPYSIAFNLSKYIYLRLGIRMFVYVADSMFLIRHGFIMRSNKLAFTVLDHEYSNPYKVSIFVLDGNNLSKEFQEEFTDFCFRIIKPSFPLFIHYDKSADEMGFIDVGNTYQGSPKLDRIACLSFNENKLAEAEGKTLEKNCPDVSDYSIRFDPKLTDKTFIIGVKYKILIDTDPVIPDPTKNARRCIYNVPGNSDMAKFRALHDEQYIETCEVGEFDISTYFYYLHKVFKGYKSVHGEYKFILDKNKLDWVFETSGIYPRINLFTIDIPQNMIKNKEYEIKATAEPKPDLPRPLETYIMTDYNNREVNIYERGGKWYLKPIAVGQVKVRFYLLNLNRTYRYIIKEK